MPVTQTQAFRPGFIKQVRERIARIIESNSANLVPAICTKLGLADGDVADAFRGKYVYANTRLQALSNYRILEIADNLAQDEGDPELLTLLASLKAAPIPPPTEPPANSRGRRSYYAERNGKGPGAAGLTLNTINRLFISEFKRLEEAGYFAEHFGFFCEDEPDRVPGLLGSDIESQFLFHLGNDRLWPIGNPNDRYTEDEQFSLIEFLFDHVSYPVSGTMHSYNSCGMHWKTFSTEAGQKTFREAMNRLLDRYRDGFELTARGEIMERAPQGTENLLATPLPNNDSNIQGRVDSAVAKFRRRQATIDDRRDAVRDLADVLEYLRPQAKEVLTKKDDGALFQIANEFGIRHHNTGQKTDYDQPIWLSWMFYFYLATIHALVRLIAKAKGDKSAL